MLVYTAKCVPWHRQVILQWSVLAMRNLCEKNLSNQQTVADINFQGLADNVDRLAQFGISAELRDGKIFVKPSNNNSESFWFCPLLDHSKDGLLNHACGEREQFPLECQLKGQFSIASILFNLSAIIAYIGVKKTKKIWNLVLETSLVILHGIVY